MSPKRRAGAFVIQGHTMKNGIVTLTYGKIAHLDATTGPTDWAGRSIELERKMGMEGHAPAPPSESRRPGQIEAGYEIDATTGATVDATSGATRSISHDNVRESAAEAHGDMHKGRGMRSGYCRRHHGRNTWRIRRLQGALGWRACPT